MEARSRLRNAVEEGVLDDVAGVLVVADDAPRHGQQAGGVGANQFLVGVAVRGAQAR